jgi:hypothetical protein
MAGSRKGRIGATLAAVSLLAAEVARAQDAPPADALRGPTVKEATRPATLVHREMGGALVRLETRPEEAALGLLDLTKDQRAAADKVLAERYAAVSKQLSEHYDLFLKIVAARQGGAQREELAPMLREFRAAAAPLFEKPLEASIAAALPEDKATVFRSLVDEYEKALAAEDESRRPQGGAGAAPNERMTRARQEISLTLREMGRVLRSIVQERRERADELIQKLGATPEQEEKIRSIIRETAGKNGVVKELKEDQRRELMQKILAELTPEQRKAAIEKLRVR